MSFATVKGMWVGSGIGGAAVCWASPAVLSAAIPARPTRNRRFKKMKHGDLFGPMFMGWATPYSHYSHVVIFRPDAICSVRRTSRAPLNSSFIMRALKIIGSISPTVRPDLQGMAKARVQQELDKHKDELKQKAQDQLKGLFGR